MITNIVSLADKKAQDYIANLQALRHSLYGQTSTSTAVVVHRVLDKADNLGKSTPSPLRSLFRQLTPFRV